MILSSAGVRQVGARLYRVVVRMHVNAQNKENKEPTKQTRVIIFLLLACVLSGIDYCGQYPKLGFQISISLEHVPGLLHCCCSARLMPLERMDFNGRSSLVYWIQRGRNVYAIWKANKHELLPKVFVFREVCIHKCEDS